MKSALAADRAAEIILQFLPNGRNGQMTSP
jgi:hypothetical protein